jgi:hypothetical protein
MGPNRKRRLLENPTIAAETSPNWRVTAVTTVTLFAETATSAVHGRRIKSPFADSFDRSHGGASARHDLRRRERARVRSLPAILGTAAPSRRLVRASLCHQKSTLKIALMLVVPGALVILLVALLLTRST